MPKITGLTEEQMQRWIELQFALENFRSDVHGAKAAAERTSLVRYCAVALADDPPGMLGS